MQTKLESRVLCPRKSTVVDNVDTFTCQSVEHENCGILTTFFQVPRGKLFYNIILHPCMRLVYRRTTLYPPEFCEMDWAILIDGRRLEHIKITPNRFSQKVYIDRKLTENNLLQMQIDLTNVTLVAPPIDSDCEFIMRVEGILADGRDGSGIYPVPRDNNNIS